MSVGVSRPQNIAAEASRVAGNSPGKRRDAFVQGHEVVFETEMCEVLTVKQLSGQFLETAARQIDRVHPLGRNLEKEVRSRSAVRRPGSVSNGGPVVKTFEKVKASHLGGRSVPAEALRVGVKAEIVGLALGRGGAQRQTVAVPLHLLHLQASKQPAGLRAKNFSFSRYTKVAR